jgi:heme/copper-type cytochrome/quinol oxidase subunit 3
MATSASPALALPSAGGEQPRNVMPVAVLLGGSGLLMLFGALIAAYVQLRGKITPFLPEDVHLDQYLGNMMAITIVMSAFTAEWGASSVRRGLRRQALAAYGITLALGLAFLNLLSFTAGKAGFTAASSPYATVVAALALLLGLAVGVGIGFVTFTLFRVSGSQVSAAEPDQARATSWYWHFTVIAALAVWYTVVVLK